tara:strand:- start:229 stop:3543 length:3315 start_codon:yes stop_codon:yes gene_type:complete
MSTVVTIDIKYATGIDFSEIKFFDTNESLISVTDFSYNLTSGSLNLHNRYGNEGATLTTALIDNNTDTKIFTGDTIVGTFSFTMNTQPEYYQFVYSWNADETRNLVHWDILVDGTISATENFRNIAAYASPPNGSTYDAQTFPEYLHPNDSSNKYYYINGHPDKSTVVIDIKSTYNGIDLQEIKFFDANENQIDAYTQAISTSTAIYNDFEPSNNGRNINNTTDEFQLIDGTTSKLWNGNDFTGTFTFLLAKSPTYYQFVCATNHTPGRNLTHWDVKVDGVVTATEIFENIAEYRQNTVEYDSQNLPEFLHSGDASNKYYYINGHPHKTTLTIDIKSAYSGMDLQEIKFFDASENQIDAYTQDISFSSAVYNDFESSNNGRNLNNVSDEYQLIDGTTSKLWNTQDFSGTLTFLLAKSPTYYQFVCATNHTPGRNLTHWDIKVDGVLTSTENFENMSQYQQNTTEYDSQSLPEFLHPGDDSNKYYYINGHPDKMTLVIDIKNTYSGMDLQEIKFFDASENQIVVYSQAIDFSQAVYNHNGTNVNGTSGDELIDNDSNTKIWNTQDFSGTITFYMAKTPTYYQFICASNHTPGRNITHWDIVIDDVITATENFKNISEYQQNSVEYDSQALPEYIHSGDDSNKYYYVNGHPDKTTVRINIKEVYSGIDLAGINFYDASENQIDVYTQSIEFSKTVYDENGNNINNTNDQTQLIDNDINTKVWNAEVFTGDLTFLMAKRPKYYQFVCASNHTPGRNITNWITHINGLINSEEDFTEDSYYQLNTTEYDSQNLPEFLYPNDSTKKYYVFTTEVDYDGDGDIDYQDMHKLIYNKPIDFAIYALSSTKTMTTAATMGYPTESPTVDISATAVFYMSQTDIRNVFKIRVNSTNMNDVSNSDIMHFMFMENWPSSLYLNPMNGMMDQILSENATIVLPTPNKMLVKHDFLRYISKKLFNTVSGVSLFNNEATLVSNLTNMGKDIYDNTIGVKLNKYSTTSNTPLETGFVIDPVTGLKATTNDNTSNDNICRVLLNTLMENVPSRFSDISGVMDASGVFSLPIDIGDTINFFMTIHPQANQHLLTGVPPISPRKYQIKIVIDDGTGVNTTPVD